MTQHNQPQRGVIAAFFKFIGDVIIAFIRCGNFLRSSEARERYFLERQEKRQAKVLAKKHAEWMARIQEQKITFPRLHVLARLHRLRLTSFHRHTPPGRLVAIYLAPTALLSIGLTGLLLSQPSKIPTQALPRPPLTEKEKLSKLLGETSRFLNAKQLDKAKKNLETLKALAPENITVLTYTGALHLLSKEYPAARLAYEQALAVNPTNYVARYNLAELEFISKNYAEAERRFVEVQTINPRDENIIFRLYLCALMQDSPAADQYEQKLSFDGSTPARHYAVAARLIRENQNAEARKILHQAHAFFYEQAPHYDTTFRQMGLIK